MDISFEGVGQVTATFKVSGSDVQPGMVVTLASNGTVALGSAGSALCGVTLCSVRGGAAAVQIGGVAKVNYSGTAPAVGWAELACDGTGGVKTATGGVKRLVLAVDEKTAVIKL